MSETHRIKATDFFLLTECDRRVYLDAHGDPSQRVGPSRFQKWLIQRGAAFENEVISGYRVTQPEFEVSDLDGGFALTLDLMRQGVEVIYQGVLKHRELVGVPDLLERLPGQSRFGAYHYRPIDIKTSSSAADGQRLQVMAYCAMLEGIQERRPDGALLLYVPPDERAEGQVFKEEQVIFDAGRFESSRAEIAALLAGREPRPFLSSVCGMCPWQGVCRPIAEKNQDISLIPGIQRRVWAALHERSLGTLDALARVDPQAIVDIKGVGLKTAQSLVRHAKALARGEAIRLSTPKLPRPGDAVFLDLESLPSEDVYYLMGTLITRRDETPIYQADVAETLADEERMWGAFLARMESLSGPVYHYGSFERTAMKRLAERYGGDGVDRLVERFVDLEKTVRAAAALPLQSYSLKAVAPWLGFAWTSQTQGGDDSILDYVAWLEDGDRAHLGRVLRYNEDDCRATLRVYEWLASERPSP